MIMKKTKALLIMSIIFIFLILSLCTNSYAASVSVTEEKLKQVFEEWDNDEGKIFVSNNVIKLNIENEIYSLKYDLNN